MKTHIWDEFSKSLSEAVPRRESLKRFGLVVAGTLLGTFGTDGASAALIDPCKRFCTSGTKKQRNACLAACQACRRASGRVCGSNTSLICCPSGATCCGNYCADLANDFDNCGRCGRGCREPGVNEFGSCVNGRCTYSCAAGAVYCNGRCKFLDSDPDNCGKCGKTCGGTKPYCRNGACVSCPAGSTACAGNCVDTSTDPNNCGTCGYACPSSASYCYQGTCTNCAGGATDCNGVCTNLSSDPNNCGACGVVCPSSAPYCSQGACTTCAGTMCSGACVDLYWDSGNCGACGFVCPEQTACAWGVCEGICIGC
jgi:hypothetical protein